MRRDGGLTCHGLTTLAPRGRPNWVDYTAKPVVRGGVEPPAFRFSGDSTAMPDDAERRLIGNLDAETNAHYCLAWPGVCRCWLPFGSPFGSPEALALWGSRREQQTGQGRISAHTSTIFIWLDAAPNPSSRCAGGADVRFWLPSVSTGWSFPLGECAPDLAGVKQSALDGGCGPALGRGSGSGAGNRSAGWLARA
jgi:hypothetical protein